MASIIPYTLLGIILASGFFLLLKTFSGFSVATYILWHQLYPSLVVLAILSTIQELFFRGYLMFVLKSYSGSFFIVVLIDAVLFAAMHLVFPYASILVPAAFFAGLLFASVYYYYPNLFFASLTHTILLISLIPLWHFNLVAH